MRPLPPSKLGYSDPPAANAGLFGCSVDYADARLLILPVPWQFSASYGLGTAAAPEGVFRASHQLDLWDPTFGPAYRWGMQILPLSPRIAALSTEGEAALAKLRQGDSVSLPELNDYSTQLNSYVATQTVTHLGAGKILGLLGGDHSSPYGFITSLGPKYKNFSILHIDAHFDLRDSYEGLTYSHASIMYRLLHDLENLETLVSVGIRDYSQEELELAKSEPRMRVFFDYDLQKQKLQGLGIMQKLEEVVDSLGDNVYISFDIDGLSPLYAPGTGTPVPGGLDYYEACALIDLVVAKGKKIIGFDLCEVSQGESNSDWDFNVGARILYKLSAATLSSNGGGIAAAD